MWFYKLRPEDTKSGDGRVIPLNNELTGLFKNTIKCLHHGYELLILLYCPRSSARIEQWIPNPWVARSNRVGGTNKSKHLAFCQVLFF